MEQASSNVLGLFKNVKTFIFDVDGVMTNSQMLITEKGDLLRSMTVRDGYAIKLAIKKGYEVYIITGGSSKGVESRLRNLGVNHVFSGIQNKLEKYNEIMSVLNVDKKEVLYMGDDLPDLEVMEKVGVACCPADAVPEIQKISDYISPQNGGQGAVRDVIQKSLTLQNKW